MYICILTFIHHPHYPSGKEIILRKYLEDQAGLGAEAELEDPRIGFVSQALGHLEHEWGGARGHSQRQRHEQQTGPNFDFQEYPPPGSVRNFHLESQYHEPDRGYEVASGFYDETDHRGDHSYRDQPLYYSGEERPVARISPKHQIRSVTQDDHHYHHHHHHKIIINIRTPIIEETESTVERELLSRDQSRRFRMSDSVQVIFSSFGLRQELKESRFLSVCLSSSHLFSSF